MATLLLRATSALALIAFALGGCSRTCGDNDRACASKAMQNHSARKLESWKATLSVPLEARIGPAPAHVVEYLHLDNIFNGFPERPRIAKLDAAFLADVHGAFAEVPAQVRALIRDRFLGLYFVENLGGTGYTEAVLDSRGQEVAAFAVFDAALLGRFKANEWATWKETTPFAAHGGFRLEARIADPADDNRKNAIQYILLHELGHVLAVGVDVHPSWQTEPKNVQGNRKYPFLDLSWRVNRDANKYESVFDRDFPQRTRIAYYTGAKLSAADMAATYANLQNTSFASLYAATRPEDDFAESFASYVHVVVMKRPWEITIRDGGNVTHTFKPCWDEPRCAAKRKILEDLLKR